MRTLIILGGVCSVLVVGLCELLRRRHERLEGPHYVAQVRAWHEREPYIKPLDLPPVKALKAEGRQARLDKVLRFHERLSREQMKREA